MNAKTDPHNYGVDLLRIVAMLMIAAHHFSLHSGLSFEPGSFPDVLMGVLALGGKTGTNVFVLITGFYASGRIRYGKVFGLIGCATLYSLVLTAAALLTGSVSFSMKTLVKAVFPLLFGKTYWFVTIYLELYILMPALNWVAERLKRSEYRNYLILFVGILCFLPKVAGRFIYVNDLGYSELVWFVYLYFLGAYLRKYDVASSKNLFLLVWICGAAIQIAACILLRCGKVEGLPERILECAADYSANALFPLLIAVSMLLWFRTAPVPGSRRFVRLLGSATLGVYLFHDNINFRGWLWQAVFRVMNGAGTWPFAVSAVLSILAVFVLGFAVELLRMGISKYLCRNSDRNRFGK